MVSQLICPAIQCVVSNLFIALFQSCGSRIADGLDFHATVQCVKWLGILSLWLHNFRVVLGTWSLSDANSASLAYAVVDVKASLRSYRQLSLSSSIKCWEGSLRWGSSSLSL